MKQMPSCVLLSTPTSGTGSLWRVVTAITSKHCQAEKICQELEGRGQGDQIASWKPEPFNHIYLYNTPHRVNTNLANRNIKLITNFRDPRDLVCNQYHWAFQHPVLNKTEEELKEFRTKVKVDGIDAYALRTDANIQFKCFTALTERVLDPTATLNLSYSQLCLDFDGMVDRIIGFLGIDREDVLWDVVDEQRGPNLSQNRDWIGQMWTGTDIAPGRYRRELTPETIAALDARYSQILGFLQGIEAPRYRALLATSEKRAEMEQVLFGSNNYLFLQKDANDTLAQITGRLALADNKLSQIAVVHRSRQLLGTTMFSYRYAHAIVPSKEVAGSKALPPEVGFEESGPRPVKRYFDRGFDAVWEPIYRPQIMIDGFAKYYPVTDTHWNHTGALDYLRAVLDVYDPSLAGRLAEIPMKTQGSRQRGDLAIKVGLPPETIEIISPQKTSARLLFTNDITNEGCVRWYRNDAVAGGRRAIILHDSFTQWLLGFLPELFSELFMLHGTCLDYEFTAMFKPTDILFIQAERFFPRVPTTADILTFVAEEERRKNCKRPLSQFLAETEASV